MSDQIRVLKIDQIAIVVRNLEDSMEKITNILGIKPWKIYTFAPPKLTETYVRGKPVEYGHKLALARLNNIELELIEPIKGESIYTEFLRSRGEGLHHVATFYDSYERGKRELSLFEKHGIKVIQSGRYIDIRFYYLDTEELLGFIYEISYIPPESSKYPPDKVYP